MYSYGNLTEIIKLNFKILTIFFEIRRLFIHLSAGRHFYSPQNLKKMKKAVLSLAFLAIATFSIASTPKKQSSKKQFNIVVTCFTLRTVCAIETTMCYVGNPSPSTFARWIFETDEEICGPQTP